MQQYLDLLQEILENGQDRPDRTGTGVRGLFGRQLRFDLSKGLPLVTTKKIHFKSVVHELLWFIAGDTNIRRLNENGVRIWDEWAQSNGDLGPVYGAQLRRQIIPRPTHPILYPKTEWSTPIDSHESSSLKSIWKTILDKTLAGECELDPSWLSFETFKKDVQKLPRWAARAIWPNEYDLDNNLLARSNGYGPDTCIWASKREQLVNSSGVIVYFPSGKIDAYTSVQEAVERIGYTESQIIDRINDGTSLDGFRFVRPTDSTSYLINDQLRDVVAELLVNPFSRRLVLSFWNPSDLPYMALPPCHGIVIQFYVSEGRLSCLMHQRSCDAFLGLPFNIASYALLTEMICKTTNFLPGELIISLGDVHIYSNHFDQCALQIQRTPKNLPFLQLPKKDLFEYRYEDIGIEGYDPHPRIPAKVAV